MDGKEIQDLFGEDIPTKKVTEDRCRTSHLKGCSIEDLFQLMCSYVPNDFGNMTLAQLNKQEQLVLKNLSEAPEHILNLICLTSKARKAREIEVFRDLVKNTAIETWMNLNSENPWYDNSDTLLIMWAIDYQGENEQTMGELLNALKNALKKLLCYKLTEDPDTVFSSSPHNFFEDMNSSTAINKLPSITFKGDIQWITKLFFPKENYMLHEIMESLIVKKFLTIKGDSIPNLLLSLFFFIRIPIKINDPIIKFIIGYLLKNTFRRNDLPFAGSNTKLERLINGITDKLNLI